MFFPSRDFARLDSVPSWSEAQKLYSLLFPLMRAPEQHLLFGNSIYGDGMCFSLYSWTRLVRNNMFHRTPWRSEDADSLGWCVLELLDVLSTSDEVVLPLFPNLLLRREGDEWVLDWKTRGETKPITCDTISKSNLLRQMQALGLVYHSRKEEFLSQKTFRLIRASSCPSATHAGPSLS